jgi:hypothetical protein
MSRGVWSISAVCAPTVHRHCPRCDEDRRFGSSGKFRVNAQKRRIDVWLVYLCPRCRFSWNATIVERKTPEEIGAARYPLFQENDAATAWRCAFAVPGADRAVPYRVDREAAAGELSIRLVDPVRVRLDRLLAGELGLSRSEVSRRMADGRIGGDLGREVVDGQLVWLGG